MEMNLVILPLWNTLPSYGAQNLVPRKEQGAVSSLAPLRLHVPVHERRKPKSILLTPRFDRAALTLGRKGGGSRGQILLSGCAKHPFQSAHTPLPKFDHFIHLCRRYDKSVCIHNFLKSHP